MNNLKITIVYNVNIGTKYNRTSEINYVAAVLCNDEYVDTLYIYNSNYTELIDKSLNLCLTYLNQTTADFSCITYNDINLEYNSN
jgi:hypothetical protein